MKKRHLIEINSKPAVVLSSNEYDELGFLKKKYRHDGLDTEEYAYNIHRRTTRIRSGDFEENLYYNSKVPSGAAAYYNGNIAATSWTYNGVNHTYFYSYDRLNRLVSAGHDESMTYEESFLYDKNGNMLSDKDRNIVSIRYNILNLPDTVQFGDGNQIINLYSAAGQKLVSRNFTILTPVTVPIGQTRQWTFDTGIIEETGIIYVDNIEYTLHKDPDSSTNANGISLTRLHNPEGYTNSLTLSCGPLYQYYRRDHLGNNREVWRAPYQQGSTLKPAVTLQRTQYYASGLPWEEGVSPSVQPYKYNGKEFVETHGYDVYDLGWRTLHNAKMRFDTMDPMAEKYPWVSPYAYCGNNPINRIDPTGMDWYWANYDDEKKRTLQYDPNITKDSKLGEEQKYAGVTYQVKNNDGKVIENYRKDGSIMFANETSAYNRMWSQATDKKIEESGYALKNGKFLVIPDYKNEADDATPSKYGYSVKDGTLSTENGETFKITGNVHTHQDPSGDATPSFWTGTGWGDVGHSKAMGGLPIITIGHDGKVHGAFWSVKDSGFRSIPGFGSRQDLLSGKTKLVPWLKTYPTRGK